MDRDEVWRTIDQQRAELADLMETFTEAEWETPSLCSGLAGPRGCGTPDARADDASRGDRPDHPRPGKLQPDDL